jgi:hypothetical protein
MADHHLPFQDRLVDGPVPPAPSEEEMAAKLFNRTSVGEMLADIERELGITPPRKPGGTTRRVRLLTMDDPGHLKEMEDILAEDSGCRILMWKEHWTPAGEFRIFLVYEKPADKAARPDPAAAPAVGYDAFPEPPDPSP